MTQLPDPDVELVVLVTDQESTLADSWSGLRAWLDQHRSSNAERWCVTLVDNGSTDGTARVAQALARPLDDVDFVALSSCLGAGDLRALWASSAAPTVVFLEMATEMDLDTLLGPVSDHARCEPLPAAVDRPSISGLVNRRAALAAIGGIGLTALVTACAGQSSSTAKASTSSTTELPPSPTRLAQSSTTTTAALHPVSLAPEIIEGPYYLDVKKVRSNIAEDRKGAALVLNLVIVEAASGAPIKGAAVDVWHADADGLYSGFVETSAGINQAPTDSADDGTFLRGTQLSDKLGRVGFTTIYPGWYTGRTVHVHVKVHVKGAVIHTGQLYFDDTLTDKVFASAAPYAARAKRDVRNVNDPFYGDPGRRSMLAVFTQADGYTTTMTLGMKAT